MEFIIYCRRLKSQYFGASKSGDPKTRGLLMVAGIAGGVPTPLVLRVRRLGYGSGAERQRLEIFLFFKFFLYK